MQRQITQLEALDVFRQASELYSSSDYSMYQPKAFSKEEMTKAQLQFVKAAILLESIPADLVSTEMKTLLVKCYLQDLYFTRLLQASTLNSNDKHQLSQYTQLRVEKYRTLLTESQHLTESDKRIQLLICGLFMLGKNRGKGYSRRVNDLACNLDNYYPANEHVDFFEKLTECERMNFAWHAECVAEIVKRNGGVGNKYLELAQSVKTMLQPTMLVVTKAVQEVVTDSERSPIVDLNAGAKAALHRSRVIGKSERDELLETFSEFLESVHQLESENLKKLKMNQ